MQTLFADFETYYDDEYSLRNLTPVEYILDPRFETIACAFKWGWPRNDAHPQWVEGPDLQAYFDAIDPSITCLVTHNALFDACICAWVYNFRPKLLVDTMGVSRAVLGHLLRSHSLESVAAHLNLGAKGKAIHNAKGMHLADLKANPLFYKDYSDYGLNDVTLCAGVYEKLVKSGIFPASELLVMDMVLRCAVNPKLQLDQNVLAEHYNSVVQQKEYLLAVAMLAGADDKKALMSNDRFAALLRELGVEPPLKISKTTGKVTHAFAKTDPGMIELESHENPAVQAVVAARVGHKSTLEETRTKRIQSISNLQWSGALSDGRWMPVPLRYGAAHTHRLGGDWKLNLQNIPRKSPIRRALIVPPGKVLVAADASQIEARGVAWICGQNDLVEQFANGEDVYASFATEAFGFPVSKKTHPGERFVGKTCIAEGTLVYTNRGLVPIELVAESDSVWDGEEWVCHQGVAFNGLKTTLPICGAWLTPDHLVWSGTSWMEAGLLHGDENTLCQALEYAAASLPSLVTSSVTLDGLIHLSLNAIAGASTLSEITRLKRSVVRDAPLAPSLLPSRSDGGNTLTLCRTPTTGTGCSAGWLPPLHDVIAQIIRLLNTTGRGACTSTKSGGKTDLPFCDTSKHFLAGMIRRWRWIERTPMEATSRETSGLYPARPTSVTDVESKTSKQKSRVYDVLSAGPRKRFTIHTDQGPLIVHNCVLGLGYQSGWSTLQNALRVGSRKELGSEMSVPDEDAMRYVQVYRGRYRMIPVGWSRLNTTGLHALANGVRWEFGPCVFEKHAIVLPNGLRLHYNNLRRETTNGNTEWWFDYADKPEKIYGGKLMENIVQALSRIIVMQAGGRIQKRLREELALQVHDELGYVVDEEIAQDVKQVVVEEMSRRPSWAPGWPLAAEGKIGKNYGEMK